MGEPRWTIPRSRDFQEAYLSKRGNYHSLWKVLTVTMNHYYYFWFRRSDFIPSPCLCVKCSGGRSSNLGTWPAFLAQKNTGAVLPHYDLSLTPATETRAEPVGSGFLFLFLSRRSWHPTRPSLTNSMILSVIPLTPFKFGGGGNFIAIYFLSFLYSPHRHWYRARQNSCWAVSKCRTETLCRPMSDWAKEYSSDRPDIGSNISNSGTYIHYPLEPRRSVLEFTDNIEVCA